MWCHVHCSGIVLRHTYVLKKEPHAMSTLAYLAHRFMCMFEFNRTYT